MAAFRQRAIKYSIQPNEPGGIVQFNRPWQFIPSSQCKGSKVNDVFVDDDDVYDSSGHNKKDFVSEILHHILKRLNGEIEQESLTPLQLGQPAGIKTTLTAS